MGMIGNVNAAHKGLLHCLQVACAKEDYARLRKGVSKLLTRFAEHGAVADAIFIRDSLDGKRSMFDLQGIDSNGLTSLQVLFVEAAVKLSQEANQRVIEHAQTLQPGGEKGPIMSLGGDGREPER
jgi:hypothetical protein